MTLRTRWALALHDLRRVPEKIWTWLAWHAPKKLAYWCAIRVGAHATTGEYSDQVVPELPFVDALKRWETA